jgi:hypothetical protein
VTGVEAKTLVTMWFYRGGLIKRPDRWRNRVDGRCDYVEKLKKGSSFYFNKISIRVTVEGGGCTGHIWQAFTASQIICAHDRNAPVITRSLCFVANFDFNP